MPELPDITLYLEALQAHLGKRVIKQVIIKSPFLLRTFDPPIQSVQGKTILGFCRMGKRIVWELSNELFLVFHLMITGRFHWKRRDVKPQKKTDLAAFLFDNGTLLLTEAGKQQRASLHLVKGAQGLQAFALDGLEVLECSLEQFKSVLIRENHTLKRALTNPSLFSGIGNAYSDEILHTAKLSPMKMTSLLKDAEVERLFKATCSVLQQWIERLRKENAGTFPEKVTAFHPAMAVHGKFNEPCPVCRTRIQRIVYAQNQTNYCPRCQTGGKVLADRALSQLLKKDRPRTVEEADEKFESHL